MPTARRSTGRSLLGPVWAREETADKVCKLRVQQEQHLPIGSQAGDHSLRVAGQDLQHHQRAPSAFRFRPPVLAQLRLQPGNPRLRLRGCPPAGPQLGRTK